jgi:hypothetical protein
MTVQPEAWPSDVKDKDPVNQIQTGYYDNGSGGLITELIPVSHQ